MLSSFHWFLVNIVLVAVCVCVCVCAVVVTSVLFGRGCRVVDGVVDRVTVVVL